MGKYKSSLPGVLELVQKMEAGELEAGKMYTVGIGTSQFQLNSLYINSFEDKARQLKDLEAQGKIHLVTITELVDIWKTKYSGVPIIYRVY